MTITVTYEQLVSGAASLNELAEINELKPSVSARVSRALRKSRDALREWNDRQQKILEETGKAAPHPAIPGTLILDPKNPLTLEETQAMNAKFGDLNKTEVPLEVFKMKLSEFGENAKLKPRILTDLDWLIEE